MRGGQAEVADQKCVACGTCIRQCPQEAKVHHSQQALVGRLLAGGRKVLASVAPSFAGKYAGWRGQRLTSALRRLGFAGVYETAEAAWHVATATRQWAQAHPDRSLITTACPATVRYITRYAPDLVEALAPIASPMIAHGRLLKRAHEAAAVVFIGPCVAKKDEAARAEHAGAIDAVLTFEELDAWLAEAGIDLARLEDSAFDGQVGGQARLFPLEGGQLRTAGLLAGIERANVVSTGGFEELVDALDWIRRGEGPVILEPLFCEQGCLNGPAMGGEPCASMRRRHEVVIYADAACGEGGVVDRRSLADRFEAEARPVQQAQEEDIRAELERTGKGDPADQLDCGACGYATCRDKAIAVLTGMAEPEMCLSWMRRLAERRTDRIIETSPNGIVILDAHLNILSMNPAFRKMFMCSDALLGKRISQLMDPAAFERIAAGRLERFEGVVGHEKYGLTCHEILYPLEDDGQLVGIFVNMTRSESDRDKLAMMRRETMMQARELLEHQVDMARQLAQLLGQGTAKSEGLLEKLMELTEQGPAEPEPDEQQTAQLAGVAGGRRRSRPWDTST
jgi:iron only hydrogenase large subunit-like protein